MPTTTSDPDAAFERATELIVAELSGVALPVLTPSSSVTGR